MSLCSIGGGGTAGRGLAHRRDRNTGRHHGARSARPDRAVGIARSACRAGSHGLIAPEPARHPPRAVCPRATGQAREQGRARLRRVVQRDRRPVADPISGGLPAHCALGVALVDRSAAERGDIQARPRGRADPARLGSSQPFGSSAGRGETRASLERRCHRALALLVLGGYGPPLIDELRDGLQSGLEGPVLSKLSRAWLDLPDRLRNEPSDAIAERLGFLLPPESPVSRTRSPGGAEPDPPAPDSRPDRAPVLARRPFRLRSQRPRRLAFLRLACRGVPDRERSACAGGRRDRGIGSSPPCSNPHIPPSRSP